jgi:hypothetical protein
MFFGIDLNQIFLFPIKDTEARKQRLRQWLCKIL